MITKANTITPSKASVMVTPEDTPVEVPVFLAIMHQQNDSQQGICRSKNHPPPKGNQNGSHRKRNGTESVTFFWARPNEEEDEARYHKKEKVEIRRNDPAIAVFVINHFGVPQKQGHTSGKNDQGRIEDLNHLS
jgi:hypothetical protein